MMMKKMLVFTLFALGFTSQLSAQFGDCATAKSICKKEPLHIQNPRGEGNDKREADFIHCFLNGDNMGQAEENSTWIKFEIKEGGTFSFAITPDRASDDIDFAGVLATQVRFNVQSNYGGIRSGFAEIQFKTIPEPSASLALLALGLVGIGLRKRI